MSSVQSITRGVFDSELRELRASIFSGAMPESAPFRKLHWKVVLLPYGINMAEEDFVALASAARECGDGELVIADAETIAPAEPAVIVQWSYSALQEARYREGSLLNVMDSHLFGYSATWGVVSACSLDDILYVGGEQQFVSTFVDDRGGEEALKKRFLEFATDEWSVSEETRRRVLATAGWSQ